MTGRFSALCEKNAGAVKNSCLACGKLNMPKKPLREFFITISADWLAGCLDD